MKNLSLLEIAQKIKSGETTKEKVFKYFLKRIEKYDQYLNTFNEINKNGLNQNSNYTKLQGIPIGIKDIYCEKGIKTTGSSQMLRNFTSPYESTITKKLKKEGMSSIGKLNMDEFAMGSTTENSAFKNTLNPWGNNRVPGGSSGGSASAVASSLIPAALGTDTGGSIRQPASLCGVVGFKPSYGRNSRFGIMPMASSLDCPGTFTKTVKDAAFLYEIMNGEDLKENTTIPGKDKIDNNIWETKDLKGIKLGIPKEYFEKGLDDGVRKTIEIAINDFKKLGAKIIDISLPMTKYAIASYYILVPAEVSSNLARLDGIRYGYTSNENKSSLEELYLNNRGEGLGDEPKRRSILGSYVLSAGFYDAYFLKAAQVRTLIIDDFNKAFKKVDALITPVSPEVAWKIGEKINDPLKLYLADSYTIPASLAGLPGISIPCGFAKSEDKEKIDMPVGLQILTPRLQEQKLFEIANIFEQSTPWKNKMIPKGY